MNMPTTTGVAPEIPVRNPESGSADGSLTELAALEAARTEKRHLAIEHVFDTTAKATS